MKKILFFLILNLAVAGLHAQENNQSTQNDNTPITYGTYRKIYSKILGEDRTLLISLPEDYSKSDKKYPVLYKLDGDKGVFLQTFSTVFYLVDMTDKIPDHIIVGD
jgi:predicted alpha/beta superfamily hydrolase